MVSAAVFDTELKIQKALQEREGGKTEVETLAGFVDLLTDEYVIEIKHVIDWKDGVKVLIYAPYFPNRNPRIHLFGSYSQSFREFVEKSLQALGIVVTWEEGPA
jgi:hypothetical protein